MGKTKIKTIDDASETLEPKKPVKKLGRRDELVEKLKAELEKETVDDGRLKIGVEDRKLKVEKEKIHPQPSTIKKPSSTIDHPPSKKVRSKKYQEVAKDLDKTKTYPVDEAVELVKRLSFSKFTGTLEAHINTAQTNIKGSVSLPFASDKTEYKTEAKTPVIHLGLGKLDQPTEELTANITTLLQTLGKSRVKKVTLSPTMGPSVKVDLASF